MQRYREGTLEREDPVEESTGVGAATANVISLP